MLSGFGNKTGLVTKLESPIGETLAEVLNISDGEEITVGFV